MRRRLIYLPALVLLAGAVLVESVRHQLVMPLPAPLSSVPTELLGFRSVERSFDSEAERAVGASEYLMRQYTQDAGAFSLYVGYYAYQTQGKTIHSPKNCLPGSGWREMESNVQKIHAGGTTYTVNRYVVSNGKDKALVYYWYQGRGRVTAGEYQVKWHLLRDAVLRRRTEEALVRIVVPLGQVRTADAAAGDGVIARADELARGVTQHVIPSLQTVLPDRDSPAVDT